MWSEHPSRYEPGCLTAFAADHTNRFSSPGQLVGYRQSHQAATKDESWLLVGLIHDIHG